MQTQVEQGKETAFDAFGRLVQFLVFCFFYLAFSPKRNSETTSRGHKPFCQSLLGTAMVIRNHGLEPGTPRKYPDPRLPVGVLIFPH